MRWALALGLALLGCGAGAFPVERCMNLSNYLEAPRDEAWDYTYRPEHLDRIAEAGFDTLRLPVRAGDWWVDGRLDPRFRRLVIDVVEDARAAGLTVILDLHHYRRFIKDPDKHGGQFVAIWITLAEMFAPDDGLIFELLNEPTDEARTAAMLPHYQAAITSIRKRHPEAWIIIGGANWNSLWEMLTLDPPNNDRIVHTFHYYTPHPFTHQQVTWTKTLFPPSPWPFPNETLLPEIDMAVAADHHTPVFLGEFGVTVPTDRASRLAWIETVRRAAESEGIPWCHWGFGSGFGAFDPRQQAWDPDVLDALIRP